MKNDQLLFAYKDARRFGGNATRGIAKARELVAQGKGFYGASWPWKRGAHNVTRQPDRPRYAWVENTESAGLRFVDYCDQIARRSINHKGWFTTPDGMYFDDVYRGAVWQLPGRNGVARFVAGYVDPANKGAAFICLDIISDGRDHDSAKLSAALQADSIAEHDAEKERDYQEQWQAGFRWAELANDIAARRRALLDLLSEMKAERKARGASGKAICATLRSAVQDMLEDIQEMRDDRADLFSSYGDSAGFAEHLPHAK